ncbi:MAG TPA: ABC transporter permease [Candidatus Saccharimonadales bacterium]
MHNFGTVFRFEVMRTLKKKSFWLVSLLFPVMIGAVAGIIYFSNQATKAASEDNDKQKFSFVVKDDARLVNTAMITAMGGKVADSREQAIAEVKAGKVDAFFFYPKDIEKAKIEVYGKDVGLFDNGRYDGVAKALLKQSVTATVSPQSAAVLSEAVQSESVTYRDGKEYNPFMEMIAPGIFLVLFYLMIATFGNQMLNATIEEKENRVIEMILTTINAKALIVGKIFSLIVLGFLQVIVVAVPVLIGYLLLHDNLNLPNLDLANLPLNPARIGIGFAIFSLSFILFTGLLVAIGAAAPTAKEAGSFFGIVMLFIFGPLYAVTLFVSSPEMPIVQFLSYFPFTAPIPLMLRNAVGNLEVWQALLACGILAVTALIIMLLAVRIFKYGALEYDRRLGLKEIFTRKA